MKKDVRPSEIDVHSQHCVAQNVAEQIFEKDGIKMMEEKFFGAIADGAGSLPALEEVCPKCKGTGQVPPYKQGNGMVYEQGCSSCHGFRTVLNDDGKRLKAFLARHRN